MARLKVSAAAERTLDAWLAGLMEGQIRIQDLPLCVSAWFHTGAAYGRAARQHEIDQLERLVNRLHNLAFTTDKEWRDRIEARLSQALDEAPEEVWQQIEADLRVMRGETTKHGVMPTDNASTRAATTARTGELHDDNTIERAR